MRKGYSTPSRKGPHLVLSRDDVPQALLRARLALRAAEVCVTYSGRPERAGDLRDAVAYLQSGDKPGPAGEAVALFLSRDAVAPTALTSLRSDCAARRFCDRLVELGAVRELTGRDTFRLYGI